MIRVSLIAPTPTLRAGLRAMLNRVDIEITSEASSIDDLAVLLSDDARADVLLLSNESDLRISSTYTQAIVVMSDNEATATRLRAMNLRGWGIAPNHATPDELHRWWLLPHRGWSSCPCVLRSN